jgi:thymidylate synthase (FAD)
MTTTNEVKVLDHGYVRLVETWGSDQRIIEAARMSTGKGFLGWDPGICPVCEGAKGAEGDVEVWDEYPRQERVSSTRLILVGGTKRVERQFIPCSACSGTGEIRGDAALLRYLWKHNHATPFEFGGMIIEVRAPLMVYREWHRHRSQGYNEQSARYEPLLDDNYMPTVERCMLGGGHLTKQAAKAAGATELTEADALEWLAELADVYDHAERVYQSGLRRGIPKELARLPVPVGRYSKMRATTNLRMWLAFSTLRSTAKNPAAQWEIRQYADVVGTLLEQQFPRTWAIFSGVT